MSPVARQCSRLVRLLAVLWAVGRSGANQPQPSAGIGTAPVSLRLIVRHVTANIQPLITKLASRFDGLDARLSGIETRLNSLHFKQDSFDARLDGLDSRVDELNSVVGGVGSRLDQLAANVNSADKLIDSRLDELLSRVNSTEGSLGELASELDSADNRLEARLDELVSRVNSTGGSLSSRLNRLISEVDSADSRLEVRMDELISRANSTEGSLGSRLDTLTSKVDSEDNRLEARLDELVSRVNSTGGSLSSRLDELVSRVDGLAAERGGHLNNVSSHLDDLSSRLDELANLTDPRLQPPRDCSELPAGSRSGIHLLQPGMDHSHRSRPPVKAYCDLDTDGGRWTVIQRRADVRPRQNFNLAWSAYKDGFGDLEAEFWWGLESLWRLTGSHHRQFELRVNLADFDGQRRFASYGKFSVASEADGYRLLVGDYTGDAGDSLDYHSGLRFSTKDRDHDSSRGSICARDYKAGWWFEACYDSNLNGQYLRGQQKSHGGINWRAWRDMYSLREAEMKVRPVNTN